MTYRDEQLALDERKAALQRELDDAKQTLQAQKHLVEKSKRMERELLEIERRLHGDKRRLPMLDNVRVASPCHADWSQMVGDDRVRFCGSCEKNVFNLSAMTRDEAEALIIASGAKICVRMYKRSDGTVMTEDCTVGAKKKRRKRLAAALAGVAAVGAAATFAARQLSQRAHVGERGVVDGRFSYEQVQGGIQPMPEPPTAPTPNSDPSGQNAVQGGAMIQGGPSMPMGILAADPRMQGQPTVGPHRTPRRTHR
jgi:hypothetical protein